MILENYHINSLMFWARLVVAEKIDRTGPLHYYRRARLEIEIEDQWVDGRGPLHAKSTERVVARVYLAEPQCDHEVNVCECMPLAEKRII